MPGEENTQSRKTPCRHVSGRPTARILLHTLPAHAVGVGGGRGRGAGGVALVVLVRRRSWRGRTGCGQRLHGPRVRPRRDRKSTRLNSSHVKISYAVFCLKKKKK